MLSFFIDRPDHIRPALGLIFSHSRLKKSMDLTKRWEGHRRQGYRQRKPFPSAAAVSLSRFDSDGTKRPNVTLHTVYPLDDMDNQLLLL